MAIRCAPSCIFRRRGRNLARQAPVPCHGDKIARKLLWRTAQPLMSRIAVPEWRATQNKNYELYVIEITI
jgi:hypothetical protein